MDLGFREDLMDCTSKAKEAKAKINEWNYIKLKSFCNSKRNHQQKKGQPTECKKVFVNNVSDKGLISKIYKELIQLYNKKQTIQLKNGQKT